MEETLEILNNPTIKWILFIIIPVIPAFYLFKLLPSTGSVSGLLKGLQIKLGGAFAGYFALLLLSFYSPLFKEAEKSKEKLTLHTTLFKKNTSNETEEMQPSEFKCIDVSFYPSNLNVGVIKHPHHQLNKTLFEFENLDMSRSNNDEIIFNCAGYRPFHILVRNISGDNLTIVFEPMIQEYEEDGTEPEQQLQKLNGFPN